MAVVSLGRHCQAAHQIDRLIGPGRPAQFFDWLITPHGGLIALLEGGFSGFLTPANLRVDAEHLGHHVVVDTAFGVELFHEFPVGETVAGRLSAVQAKYAALARRFLALPGPGCLFVRQVEPRDMRADHAQAIMDALGRHFASGFRLLMVSEALPEPGWEVAGVKMTQVAQDEPYRWQGCDAAWDAVFGTLEYPHLRSG